MDRLERVRTIRASLRSGTSVVGSWMQLTDSNVAEIMGHSGYQWVAIDMEHGPVSLSQLPDLFRALELGGTLPLARVASPLPINCRQALDQGAAGVVIPMISSAGQLQAIINECHWPPRGRRGVGFQRANVFGKFFEAYVQEAQESLIIAQIEHIDAVNNLESIIAVEGLDAIMVGPYDLSASLGITGEFENKKYLETLSKILSMCAKHKMPCGIHVVQPDPKMLEQRISEGYTFIAYGVDTVFLNHGAALPK
ncbi:MAG: aldolase/citrate lyase family protein [Actinomycetota bacterium]|nr:aldolase/citrate lyase family protein [Actinomycetota bacterium]